MVRICRGRWVGRPVPAFPRTSSDPASAPAIHTFPFCSGASNAPDSLCVESSSWWDYTLFLSKIFNHMTGFLALRTGGGPSARRPRTRRGGRPLGPFSRNRLLSGGPDTTSYSAVGRAPDRECPRRFFFLWSSRYS